MIMSAKFRFKPPSYQHWIRSTSSNSPKMEPTIKTNLAGLNLGLELGLGVAQPKNQSNSKWVENNNVSPQQQRKPNDQEKLKDFQNPFYITLKKFKIKLYMVIKDRLA